MCSAGKERDRKAGRSGKRSRGWGGRSGPTEEQAASGNALADFAKVVKCAGLTDAGQFLDSYTQTPAMERLHRALRAVAVL